MKIPPCWTAEQSGTGLAIRGEGVQILIDEDGVGWDGPSVSTSTFVRDIAGQQVTVTHMPGGYFFSLVRKRDIPRYYFRLNNWADGVDNIFSAFRNW